MALTSCEVDVPELSLDLIRAIPVARDQSIAGVISGSDGSIVTWDTRAGTVGRYDSHGTDYASLSVPSPIAASWVSPRLLELVQADGTILRLNRDLESVSSGQVFTPLDEVQSAAWDGHEWHTGGWRSDGSWAAYRSRATAPCLVIQKAAAGLLGARLTVAEDGHLIAATVESPRAWACDDTGRVREFEPSLAAVVDSLSGATWYGMPLLDLDRAWLQVLFDLRADTRVMVVFGRNRRVVRSSQVPVAVGLYSIGAEPGTIVGMRDTGGSSKEIVVYEWRWDEVGNSNQRGIGR